MGEDSTPAFDWRSQPHAEIERDGIHYTLLGTAHVSKASVDAVKSAIDNPEVPGQISSLFPSLLPAIYLSDSKDAATVTRTNAIVQTATLINASPVIEGAIKAGKLKVVPAVYDVGTSKVELLEIPASIRLAGR